jgi:hypothetical protein
MSSFSAPPDSSLKKEDCMSPKSFAVRIFLQDGSAAGVKIIALLSL